MSTTGERIRELRQSKKLTLDDVAKYPGVGRQAIYKYEQGTVTNIPLENLEKMAVLFDTTPEYLAGWTDEMIKGFGKYKEMLHEDEESIPKNEDIRLLIRGLNQLSPEQIKQAKDVMKAMFAKYADYFEKESDDDT